MLLGRGSNLLIRDGGVSGVVICLAHSAFSGITVIDFDLRCGAGAKLKAVAAKAREASLGGLEFLEGIPGGVGGALRMNAGAMGSATFDFVTQVRFMDESGSVWERNIAEVPVEYRSCPLFKTNIALAATFRGRPDSAEAIAGRANAFNQKRWKSQPKESSAGCIFKNPSPTVPAGKLIDELGLKGTRRGGAAVSKVHGNFIVNEGSATAGDVLELIDFIKARAKAERGIELREEVEIIGQ
jgi:UDP-N-acetylenolpyruvoylglucosamine reductase